MFSRDQALIPDTGYSRRSPHLSADQGSKVERRPRPGQDIWRRAVVFLLFMEVLFLSVLHTQKGRVCSTILNEPSLTEDGDSRPVTQPGDSGDDISAFNNRSRTTHIAQLTIDFVVNMRRRLTTHFMGSLLRCDARRPSFWAGLGRSQMGGASQKGSLLHEMHALFQKSKSARSVPVGGRKQ